MRQLFHLWLSAPCRMVRIALAEKRLPFETRVEKVWERRDEFLSLNPAGDVPVLIEPDGTSLTDAWVILEYLEEVYPEIPLIGRDSLGRAEARRLMVWFDRKFAAEVTDNLVGQKVMTRLLRRGQPDSAAIRAGKQNIHYHLDYIGFLAEQHRWLAGDELTVADIACAAHLSVVDYLGDVPWEDHAEAKEWYQADQVAPERPPAAGRRCPRRPAAGALRRPGFLRAAGPAMDVLLLGATGAIGSAVTAALSAAGHRVRALARSGAAMARVAAPRAPRRCRATCARPRPGSMPPRRARCGRALRGDLRRRHGGHRPGGAGRPAAGADRGGTARRPAPAGLYRRGLAVGRHRRRGGGRETRRSARPGRSRSWPRARPGWAAAPGLDGMVVHPGLVCGPGTGPVALLADRARATGRVAVIGGPHRRWPLVGAPDLGDLYRRVLESGEPGRQWLGVAAPGVRQGDLAATLAAGLGLPAWEPEVLDGQAADAAFGAGAACYGLDQVLSGERARRELGWQPALRSWADEALAAR